jgi:hypothetical protein
VAEWEKSRELLTREVVGSGHYCYAQVTCVRGVDVFSAVFAIPPDGVPTGKLWAALEKQIPQHFIKISIRTR